MKDRIGHFGWLDLATHDATGAARFYAGLFGWSARVEPLNDGVFTRLSAGEREIGSLYQLSRTHREAGVPSHWTPYVRVADADEAARRALEWGAQLVMPPVTMGAIARVAVLTDPTGAIFGLWQELRGREVDARR